MGWVVAIEGLVSRLAGLASWVIQSPPVKRWARQNWSRSSRKAGKSGELIKSGLAEQGLSSSCVKGELLLSSLLIFNIIFLDALASPDFTLVSE